MTTTATTRVRAGSVVAVAAGVAVVDWVTKVLASVTLDDRSVALGSVIDLRLSHNPGIAFGLGDRVPGPAIIGLTAVVTAVLVVATVRGVLGPWWASGLVLGGAVANLGDRVTDGSVVDFLDLGWLPSFNLADVSLSVGSALLVLASLRAPASEPA